MLDEETLDQKRKCWPLTKMMGSAHGIKEWQQTLQEDDLRLNVVH